MSSAKRVVQMEWTEALVQLFWEGPEKQIWNFTLFCSQDQYVFLNQCALDVIKSRMGTNVDLIYQNTGAMNIYENLKPNLP